MKTQPCVKCIGEIDAPFSISQIGGSSFVLHLLWYLHSFRLYLNGLSLSPSASVYIGFYRQQIIIHSFIIVPIFNKLTINSQQLGSQTVKINTNFRISNLGIQKVLLLVKTSHVTCNIQSDCFISALHGQAMLKFVYEISYRTQYKLFTLF